MPPLIKIFSPKGTKYAFLVLGMLLAVGWVLVGFELVNRLIVGYGESVTGVDTTLMLGVFIGLIGVGFLTSMIAKDRRGLTYGVYAGLAGMAISGVMLWRSGLLAALVAGVALFGGYNGGSLGELYQIARARHRR